MLNMARMSLSSIMLHHPYRPDGWYAVLHTSVPWITFHRDIHRGYPQVTVDETRQEGCRRERHVAAPGTSGTTKGPNHILKINIII